MTTKNVQYAERPDEIIVRRASKGAGCSVEIPIDVEEKRDADGNAYWEAGTVYTVECGWTEGLIDRVRGSKAAWIERAQEVPEPKAELQDVIEAMNFLTDLVLGGEAE